MDLSQRGILKIKNLSKSFLSVKALDNVSFDLMKGEVHALMGENGAGKSTLMKILMGLLSPDSGEVIIDQQAISRFDVPEMLQRGVAMIHQEILNVPTLTVAQNIFLGRETTKWLPHWLDDLSINKQTETLLQQLELNIDPKTLLKNLSIAQMQMVEIAKAVSNKAKIIIMDEPTSALSDKEVALLFKIIGDLKSQGVAIVYISHKMDEIYKIADRVTVFRDGKYIGTKNVNDLSNSDLIKMMVGRDLADVFVKSVNSQSDQERSLPVLSVKNLSAKNIFKDINFDLQAGEILGMAGLMGAGRTEIARAVFGLDSYDSGQILVNQKLVRIKSPQDAIHNRIGYVSEDRKGLGFIGQMSVAANVSLTALPNYSKGWFVDSHIEAQNAQKTVSDLQIKVENLTQKVSTLSGGNQQKVVIGRVLLASPQILILDEPTRGIDVGAKFEIYKLIKALTAKGIAILLISSELPEILGLSDRIMVIAKGKQTAMLSKSEATQEVLMRFAMQ
jgi:inositol transport system ATP-binding protein